MCIRDRILDRICEEARAAIAQEPLLGGMVHSCILHHANFEGALAFRIAEKIASPAMSEQLVREVADQALRD